MSRRIERLVHYGVVLVAVVAIGAGLHRALWSPAGRVFVQDPAAPWIMADTPVHGGLRQYGRAQPSETRFATSLDVSEPPHRARLRLRAFGSARVQVNGLPIESIAQDRDRPASWRRPTLFEIGPKLTPGANAIQISIANAQGPALLSVSLESTPAPLSLGGPDAWRASVDDGPMRVAILGTDQRPIPDAQAGESPFAMLLSHGPLLAALAFAAAALFVAVQRRVPGPNGSPDRTSDGSSNGSPGGSNLVRRALLAASLAWIALFATKLAALPLGYGFDVEGHQAYIAYLRENLTLPTARDGWAMYHPPLFHALSGLSTALLEIVGLSHALATKLLPFVVGLGNIWLCTALTRRLLPKDAGAQALAALFGACLPVNLVLAAYPSNEGLHALLCGAGLVMAVDALLDAAPRRRTFALCSALFGLALLTKFTAILVATPALLALSSKALCSESRERRLDLVAILIPAGVLAAPFYLRNWVEFGQPFAGNWSLEDPGLVWWSPPGFHTPAYYLQFGESLSRPFLSGFVSFWDGLYTTVWGDGLLGGQIFLATRHPHWNYGLMAAGYALALPASALLVAGFARAVRDALFDPRPERRAALGLLTLSCAALGYAIFYSTLSLPYYGQARALYATAAIPALAYFFASEARVIDRRLVAGGQRALRIAGVAYLGALFGSLYLGFAG